MVKDSLREHAEISCLGAEIKLLHQVQEDTNKFLICDHHFHLKLDPKGVIDDGLPAGHHALHLWHAASVESGGWAMDDTRYDNASMCLFVQLFLVNLF